MKPVFAFGEARDDERYNIVACGVYHRCRWVNEVSDGDGDGVGDRHLRGEEDRADDILSDVAAAGDARHPDRREDGDQHDQCEK